MIGQRVLAPSGRVGPFQVNLTTERVVRARAGRPTRVLVTDNGLTWLGYPHGDFFIRPGRADGGPGSVDRLAAFRTYSPTWRTNRGTRVGMTLARARRLERGGRVIPAAGCVDRAIVRVSGGTRLFVGIAERRVALLYVGPARGGVAPCVSP